MQEDQPPGLSDAEVIEIVRRVVARTDFTAHSRCQEYFRALGYDLDAVVELLVDCSIDELEKHELDHDYPSRQCYIAVFKIYEEGEPLPLYVKVALHLPEMESGYLLSFHLRS